MDIRERIAGVLSDNSMSGDTTVLITAIEQLIESEAVARSTADRLELLEAIYKVVLYSSDIRISKPAAMANIVEYVFDIRDRLSATPPKEQHD